MKFLVLLMLVAAAVTDSQPPNFPNAEGGIIEVPNHNFDSLFRRRPNLPQDFEFDTTVEDKLFGGNANIDKNANVFRIVNMANRPMKKRQSDIGVVTAPASEDPVSTETIDPKPPVDKADTGMPATESNRSPN